MSVMEVASYSLLAQATYGHFTSTNEEDVAASLVAVGGAGLTESESREFVKNYSLIAYQENTDSGFSASIFENKITHELVFSCRGTEVTSYSDVAQADLNDIGFEGVAFRQGVDLFNFYQRLIAVSGKPLMQAVYVAPGEPNTIPEITYVTSIATDDGPLAGKSFTAVGHSLGGHLAAILERIAGGAVDSVYTFNSPGFDSSVGYQRSEWFFSQLRNAQTAAVGSSTVTTAPASDKMNNINVAEDLVHKIGNMPGTAYNSFDEIVDPLGSHSIVGLSDSLALQSLFSKLDSKISLGDLAGLLRSASNVQNLTLESALDSLRNIFEGGDIEGRVPATKSEDREDFFRNIYKLQSAVDDYAGRLDVESLASLSAEKLATLMSENVAYLYAGYRLNSFAVLGDDALYSKLTNVGNLSRYDEATGQGDITNNWIADRALYLQLLLKASQVDAKGSFGDPFIFDAGQASIDFESSTSNVFRTFNVGADVDRRSILFGSNSNDDLTGSTKDDRIYGGGGNDYLYGGDGNDLLEGGSGNDRLNGGNGADTLDGMSGDDVITGNRGDDLLIGGSGNDRYEFFSGDGHDTIIDSDRDGILHINDAPIATANEVGPNSNIWMTEDGKVVFALTDDDHGRRDLIIKYGVGDQIVIQDYKLGSFGLSLLDFSTPAEPEFDRTIIGDLKPIDANPSSPGDQYTLDDLYNIVVDPEAIDKDREDTLFGSDGTDEIIGHGGSDRLYGKDGDDHLYGADKDTLANVLNSGDAPGSSLRGDWLDGGDGDDLIVGSNARDLLLGGEGEDTLVGGAGDDLIYGDAATDWSSDDWGVLHNVIDVGDNLKLYTTVLTNSSLKNPQAGNPGGDDVIYGGGGADYIFGGGGNDYVDGGEDDDLIDGGMGNDTIKGGAGADILLGDGLDANGGLASAYDGNDIIDGGDGDDYIDGNGGSDILYGGSGNDLIRGDDPLVAGLGAEVLIYSGNDTLYGGGGNDTLYGGAGSDVIYGEDGDDSISGDYVDLPKEYQGNDFLDGGRGNDSITGMGGSDTLIGGDGDDKLDGDWSGLNPQLHGNDLIYGDAGNDAIWGGGGSDTLYGGEGDDSIEGDYYLFPSEYDGDDYIDGGNGNDLLAGGGGNDTIYGGDGRDTILGGSGNNRIEGGAGNDLLESDVGDDVYIFSAGDGVDVINDAGGANRVEFGSGYALDRLSISVGNVNDVRVLKIFNDLGDGVLITDLQKWQASSFSFASGEVLTFSQMMERGTSPVVETGTSSDDTFVGGGGADSLSGGEGNDVLNGQGGDDVITGGSGDDILNGQGGNDQLNGGEGNDTYVLNAGDGFDFISDKSGNNVVSFGPGISAGDVTFNDSYTTSGSHVLQARYKGGVVSIIDGMQESNISSFNFSDGSQISWTQALRSMNGMQQYAGNTDSLMLGSRGADSLLGGAGQDTINGFEGDDFLGGGEGSDTLDGGEGNDQLYGGLGDDYLIGGDGDDTLVGGGGNDTLDGGLGNNTYAFRVGMQRDEIRYSSASSNVLRFDLPLELSDISARRDGDDLTLEYRYGDDGVTIKNYFVAPQSWSVSFSGSPSESMEDFVSQVVSPKSYNESFFENVFKKSTISSIYPSYFADGWEFSDDGSLTNTTTVDAAYSFHSNTSVISQVYSSGEIKANPSWMKASGNSVLATRSESSTVSTHSLPLIPYGIGYDIKPNMDFPPVFIPFTDSLGPIQRYVRQHDVWVTSAYNESGDLTGFLAFPIIRTVITTPTSKDFTYTTTTNTTNYSVVAGGDEGGRTNVEIGNIFNAGAGDDLVVAYLNTQARYGNGNVRTPGVFLTGGGGNDTLFGSDGDDFLSGGTGRNTLYGGDGVDTYTIGNTGAHDIIVDLLTPHLHKADELHSRDSWEYDSYSQNGKDVVYLPDGVALSQLVLSYGSVVVEGVDLDAIKTGVRGLPTDGPRADMLYATLKISWGTGQIVEIVLPHSNDPAGTGVETLKFFDGSSIGLSELIAQRGIGPVPDPYKDGESVTDYNGGLSFKGELQRPLVGGAGNDTLTGVGNIQGNGGDDLLVGGNGANILSGGAGNDTLKGGAGDDVYVYTVSNFTVVPVNDGQDLIDNSLGGYDGLLIRGADPTSLLFHRVDDDLLVVIADAVDQSIRIKNHFKGGDESIDYISVGNDFDGYSKITDDQILQLLTPIVALGELLEGSYDSDVILGGVNNDTLYGYAGDDTLLGGLGSDTYRFSGGQKITINDVGGDDDTVLFSGPLTREQVLQGLTKSGNDLVYNVDGDSSGAVNIKNFFLGGDHLVEHFVIDGGNSLGAADIFEHFGLMLPGQAPVAPMAIQDLPNTSGVLQGTAGDDLIQGYNGEDQIWGGYGNDTLEGGNGNDTLIGGVGNDLLSGGRGDDIYAFSSGDGKDIINNAGGGFDTLFFSGISGSQLAGGLSRDGDDLIFNVAGGSDSVTVKNWFLGGDYLVDSIVFADGRVTADQINSAYGVNTPAGHEEPKYLFLPEEREFTSVFGGQDGAQKLFGSSANDYIDGGAGDDTLIGGAGNDYLIGGEGQDTYSFDMGFGHDVINNLSSDQVSHDVIQVFGAQKENLWFSRNDNNLVIDILGTTDEILIQDWYASDAQKVDHIQLQSATLYANEVDNLVNAMATFGVPVGGNLDLTRDQREQLNMVLSANWQPGSGGPQVS